MSGCANRLAGGEPAQRAPVTMASHEFVLITEKSNEVELVDLRGGVVSGPATDVAIPPGSDTPLGLVTRGANGYVTIAHSDEVGLVKNGNLVALTGSGTQHAPCWLALVGAYLYSSNSPSHSVSRYVVTGTAVVLDAPIVATMAGAPDRYRVV